MNPLQIFETNSDKKSLQLARLSIGSIQSAANTRQSMRQESNLSQKVINYWD